MLRAMVSVNAVLPIDGRAAMIIKSDACQPSVTLSMEVNPEGTPLNLLSFFEASSIVSRVFLMMSFEL